MKCDNCGEPNAPYRDEVIETCPTDRGDEVRYMTYHYCAECFMEIHPDAAVV